MQLEDHVGDVLAKARVSAGVSAGDAAQLAGLEPEVYARLEADGLVAGPRPNWPALATRLGLSGAKLERLASGWLPQPRDLGAWRELRVVATARGIGVNAYLVWDEVTREAAVFDTGWDADPILQIVAAEGLQLRHVFITHSHVDHVAGLARLRERHPKARLHSGAADAPVDQRNRANDFIHLGSLRITHRATPGHSEDGVTYIVGTWPDDAPNVAFVGDAVFAGSMGKAGEKIEQARRCVREQIFTLPADTLLCPGHGPLTTVAEEKVNNSFFP